MADEEDEDLDLGAPEAGMAFKGEMLAQNMLLGYWKHLLTALGLVLAGVLFWGQYNSWTQRTQRAITEKIAIAEEGLPVPVYLLPDEMRKPVHDVSPEKLGETAAALIAGAKDASGTAATEAYLKAAELFRLAGQSDEQRAALQSAAKNTPKGPLSYASRAGLANLDLEQGEGEKAVERLKALSSEFDGFLAEHAALDLALALEYLDRQAEAQQVYAEFLERWPESKRADEVRARQGRVQGDG